MLNMKRFYALWLVVVCATVEIVACTTAVISGRYTPDGKPMLWKVRDTESLNNKMMYIDSGRYAFIGLVNTEDTNGSQVWAGSNEVGFAIMNSASFNVNVNDSSALKDQEGFFMKKALATCATLADFEVLLQQTSKPMGLAAHFGVIDGEGGAAFYEVNNRTFTKFDANDQQTAPCGYVLRTNFSFTGEKDKGLGYCRFQTAQELLMQGYLTNRLSPATFLQEYSRCFKHTFLNCDYRTTFEKGANGEMPFINVSDLITRHDTSSAIVIEGVKASESKDMSTIWVQVGFPETCVSFPLWVRAGKALPKMLTADKENRVQLSDWAMAWKSRCFPMKTVEQYRYLNLSLLVNAEKTGFLQRIEQLENGLFDELSTRRQAWAQCTPTVAELQEVYRFWSQRVEAFYLHP